MNGPSETVEASRPREQVFAFATDLSSFPVWADRRLVGPAGR
jgi:hypothetical protein